MSNSFEPAQGEDPLEVLLDAESDEEFGLPEFRHHFADNLEPAKLKDWTAQDFASIYVRFKPHLDRHARRFLRDNLQVEEVVQDAFLYLMTTLPELDSEIGVLKFLKWKVRLLSLDMIRAGSRSRTVPIGDNEEFESTSASASEQVERAEDAAIVQLALAKLQPRHREVLIATVYEEKATEVVASQLGLSENATRQLVFRARAAFRRALIGEAEIAGLSMGQILSIATKKAAKDAGRQVAAVGTFVLLVVSGFALWPQIAPTDQVALDPGTSSSPSATAQPTPSPSQTQLPPTSQTPESSPTTIPVAPSSPPIATPELTPAPSVSEIDMAFGSASLVEISTNQSLAAFDIPTQLVTMVDTQGRRISFDINPWQTPAFFNVQIEFEFGGATYKTSAFDNPEINYVRETREFSLLAPIGNLTSTEGSILEDPSIADSFVRIEVRFNEEFDAIDLYAVTFLSR